MQNTAVCHIFWQTAVYASTDLLLFNVIKGQQTSNHKRSLAKLSKLM
jgi:hypothetical protein